VSSVRIHIVPSHGWTFSVTLHFTRLQGFWEKEMHFTHLGQYLLIKLNRYCKWINSCFTYLPWILKHA
jgi:hypothetical protein